MMQFVPGRRRQVSLRGASVKEASRDELLGQVAQERLTRSLAKQAAASALFIQRVWRGRTVAREAARQARAEWDREFLIQEDPDRPPISAEAISNRMLRPLFMILRHSSCFIFPSQEAFEDAIRLATCFQLLLQSINNADQRFNYCSLALGFRDKMSKWVHQAHQVFRLACATIAKDGCGWREAEHASRGKSSASLEVANLPGLAMRIMVALTDTSTWKCFCESGQEARKKKADQVVLSLAEWLANGNGGLFLAVRAYLLANYPVPGIKDEQIRPHGRKDKFIVTASIITVMLRPLLLLSVASVEDRDQNSEGSSERVQFKASAARAAAQLSAHILTIPFLSQRLPSSLLPALKHPSALFPCIRALGVPISSLLVRLASSTSSSLNSQLGRADAQLGGVPFSAWALGNVVCLAMDSPQSKGDAGREFSAHFVSGLICEEYVQALCCLLDDLDPWLDVKRKRQREEKAVSKDNEDVGPCSEDATRGNGSVKVLEATIFQLLVESLRPLHHQWHLLQLLHEATLKGGQPVIDTAAGRKSVGGVSEPKFGLAVVAKLYANLLSAFAVLNPFGGALPVLNLLAFTPTLLPRLWDWLRTSRGLAHLITAEVEGESQQFHGTHMAPVKAVSDDKYGKTAGSRWAGAFGWKLRSRSRSTSTSHAAERADDLEGDEESSVFASKLESMRKASEGVPDDVVPVLLVFCAAYAHLLMVLDDEEFYELQVPFTLGQQRVISAMLNTMVYNGFLSSSKRQKSLFMDVAIRCLRSLYERDCRRSFCEPELWLAPAKGEPPPTAAAARAHEVATALEKMGDTSQAPALGAILTTIPHVLPFDERVQIFREFVKGDKMQKRMGGDAVGLGPGSIEIAVRRDHIVEDGFSQLNGLGSKLKCCVNVSFVNELGLAEAGLDYGGLFKEFLTDLAKAAFDPRYGLFVQTATEEGLLFPHAAAARLGHGLRMLEFLGRIVGKALYEGILLEYSFSPLFVSKLLGRYSFLDELSSLDAELHRNLVYLKHYEGDVRDLALDFTVTEELFGKHTTVELRPGGTDIPVTNENKLQYVHAVADYKLNRQMRPLIDAFARGMGDLIAPAWLGLFNAKEFNQLLSGGDHDFDVADLRRHTRYTGGYTDASRTVRLFWEVVARLEAEERCALLKFVTSCSRAPLLGFKHLQPAFTIHKVVCDTSVWAVIGGQDVDRLPSASTCYNTLKLPTYKRMVTLREKLRYAIKSNTGFELS
ncbi:unnamed protein product [Sphagnum jensenii]|uniref:HECT-type E3 ubiquitin transferase n=1 Tax=Sphagnum jensenii TaxID=128206 RepID=A0ABP0VX54_9BRYO